MTPEHIDEEQRRRRREEAAARNRKLMPNVSAILGEVREHLQETGVSTKTLKLIYGLDRETGYEVGTEGAVEVHGLDLQPRRVKQ